MNCATRGVKTLDQVYTNVAKAYRVKVHPHLGLSDHDSLMLHPQYTPKTKTAGPMVKTIRAWPKDAIPQLQDCFHTTDWDVFRDQGLLTRQSLDEYTTTVMDYITFCVDSVTSWRQIRIFPNQKPWFTPEIRLLIKARDAAYRSGDSSAYSTARAALRKGIVTAQRDHNRHIEAHFNTSTNPRQVWQGVRAITDYMRTTSASVDGSSSLAEELNFFLFPF